MYQQLFFNILEVSIVISIIVSITFLLLKVIDKHYGFKWRKLLWIVLAIRLLIPYNFTLPETPIRLFQSEKIMVQEGKRIYLTEYASKTVPGNPSSSEKDVSPAKPESNTNRIPSEDAFQIPLLVLFEIIWGIGAFVYLRNQQLNYRYFLDDLDESTLIEGGPYYQLLTEICNEFGFKKIPQLYINESISSPFIIGYFHPILFIPNKAYNRKELEFIYRHECTHYKNHDLLYKLIITIAVGIHWFNPILHYMKRLAFRDVELVCDQKMAKSLSPDERKMYCNTLIRAASTEKWKEINLSTCFIGSKDILKQRMRNIFDMKKKKKGIVPLFCIFVLMLVCGGSISCGKEVNIPKPAKEIKAEEKTSKETPKEEVENQEPVTYVLPITFEEKENLHLDEPFRLENYYCRQTRNARTDYRIDENNVLWEGEHILAEDVIHIASNELYMNPVLLYVTKSGEMYGIGANSDIFFTDPLNEVVVDSPKLLMKDVAYAVCSRDSVTVLKKDSSVWIWGYYRCDGTTDVESDSLQWSWGNYLQYNEPTCILNNAIYITSSIYGDTAAAITKGGELWTWGSNLYGECGESSETEDMLIPGKRIENVDFVWLEEETERTYIKKKDGSLWTCGREVGTEMKTIDYGLGLEKVICTSQFMPLSLEEK